MAIDSTLSYIDSEKFNQIFKTIKKSSAVDFKLTALLKESKLKPFY